MHSFELGGKSVEASVLSDTSSSLQYWNFYQTQSRRQQLFSSKQIFFLVSLFPDSFGEAKHPDGRVVALDAVALGDHGNLMGGTLEVET